MRTKKSLLTMMMVVPVVCMATQSIAGETTEPKAIFTIDSLRESEGKILIDYSVAFTGKGISLLQLALPTDSRVRMRIEASTEKPGEQRCVMGGSGFAYYTECHPTFVAVPHGQDNAVPFCGSESLKLCDAKVLQKAFAP